MRCFKWPRSFFCSCFSPVVVHLRNLSSLRAPVARILLTPRRLSRLKDVKQSSVNISKLKVGVKHSISRLDLTMDLFYLSIVEIKKSPIDSLITESSFENLSYLLSERWRWRLRRMRSYVSRGSEPDLVYTKVLGVVSQHISRSGNLWHPLSSSMLKNK